MDWAAEREARAAVAELRRMRPDYTVAGWLKDGNGWSDNTVFLAEFQRIDEGLRKATHGLHTAPSSTPANIWPARPLCRMTPK